ncbi:site-specific integrase [Clostridia bacterium]|nr:site-specific integrase [Clostridia bacterium]
MATARKRAGSWRVLVFAGIENGKRKYESFTAPTKREAELAAAQWSIDRKQQRRDPDHATVETTLRDYINARNNVLSPSTIRAYDRYTRIFYDSINERDIFTLTKEELQKWVNDITPSYKPKSVHNAYGLLTAAIKEKDTDFSIKVKLPRVDRSEPKIPEIPDVNRIIEAMSDIHTYAAFMLASECGMRRSEIAMLEWRSIDFDNGIIKVTKALVQAIDNSWVTKSTKSRKSTRSIETEFPVLDALKALPNIDERIFYPLSPEAIAARIKRVTKSLGMGFSMHNFRHYHASIMLALGIPDKYAAERLGHGDTRITKDVYQHTMSAKRSGAFAALNDFFKSQHAQMQPPMQPQQPKSE